MIIMNTFYKVSILGPLAIHSSVSHPLPVPPCEIKVRNLALVNSWTKLTNVSSKQEQPPLPKQRKVICGTDFGSNDTHGVRAGEDVDEEEVKLLVLFVCADQQGNGSTLGSFELSFGIRDGPAIPVFEQDGLLLFVFDQGGIVIFSGFLKERTQTGVLMHLLDDFEWILRRPRRRFGV
jgi:hypothetical protein